MRLGAKSWTALVLAVILAAGGWLAFQRYWYYVPRNHPGRFAIP